MSADVAQLLAASREAHLRKKHAAGVVDAQGTVLSAPNYTVAEQHVAAAVSLRLQAHALDPLHLDPAWAADQLSNKGQTDRQLLSFFVAYSKPLIPAEQMAQLTARFPEMAAIAYLP